MDSLKIDKINFFGKTITCNNVTNISTGIGVSITFENKKEIDTLNEKIKQTYKNL